VLASVNRLSKQLKMDKWCDDVVAKDLGGFIGGSVMEDDVLIGARRVYIVRSTFLKMMQEMSPTAGYHPVRILQKIACKRELIKTIQAVKSCSSPTNTDLLDKLVSTSIVNNTAFYSDQFAPSDKACTSEELGVNVVSQELLHLLALNLLFVLFTDEKKQLSWNTLAALRSPAPRFDEQPVGTNCINALEVEHPSNDPNCILDPSWLCASAPFAPAVANLCWSGLSKARTSTVKTQVAVTSWLNLLSDIEAELQTQLDLMNTLQVKILSGISTLVFALLSLVMTQRHMQPIETYLMNSTFVN